VCVDYGRMEKITQQQNKQNQHTSHAKHKNKHSTKQHIHTINTKTNNTKQTSKTKRMGIHHDKTKPFQHHYYKLLIISKNVHTKL